MKRVCNIIDGYGIFFRSFYGIGEMRTSGGIPTGAIYGFIKALLRILKDYKSDDIYIAVDSGKKSFRSVIDASYKANRVETPEELRPQFAILRELFEASSLPWLEYEGFEADDIIATVARNNATSDVYTQIFTFDKDLMALVHDGHSEVIDYIKGERYYEKHVYEKFGIPAKLVSDYLAIIGDSSDNIPGIKGCGPKAAKTLLEQFGSLDAILAEPEKIANPNIRAKVLAGLDGARVSQKLAALCFDVPIVASQGSIASINFKGLQEFLKKYEINISLPKQEEKSATSFAPAQSSFDF